MSLSSLVIPRNRKVQFELEILIQELVNVPLVTGLYYIKWKLKNGKKTNGMTERAPIKYHSIAWNYKLHNSVQIIIGKDGVLMPCELIIKVKQELSGGKEVNNIGRLLLNLSEYVGLNTMTRRYLLQDSKINSTLKLTINMKQTFGNVVFKVPPLKKTQIFGGIAGIISERTERQDDERSLQFGPNLGIHYMARSRSATSLRSAYYSQATQVRPTTSSLVANSFLRKVGDKSPTDVIDKIFMGTAVLHIDDVIDDNKSDHSAFF
ncbi:N-terminal C2 in EEIG1 and EHBP1 proteins-domain-containing protein [Glomus cerebriforme]|uniref:N-terminal C2 in EEIG1 and EHBP1 proteins-domain-containing protein n=1 Tax=Glomus cerebriforme TaxID=658196 RepID=A0A397T9L5_9GLOM|nr:N-terminal C2 in EEIG1 and EHBP1 proteins-domain-containing protein [Glomus cerebriforme]